jgi:hypothetical protein
LSAETYQYITLISFKGSLSPGEEGSLCFGERGHFQLAKGTFLSRPRGIILVCFIQLGENRKIDMIQEVSIKGFDLFEKINETDIMEQFKKFLKEMRQVEKEAAKIDAHIPDRFKKGVNKN